MQREKKDRNNSATELPLLPYSGHDIGASEFERMLAEKFMEGPELKCRSAFDAVDTSIHILDQDFKFILFNKAFLDWNKKLGLETDVIGKTVFEVFPFLPDRVIQEYREVFKAGRIISTEEHINTQDTDIVAEVRKIPIFKNSKVVNIVTVIRDITQRKKKEEILFYAAQFPAEDPNPVLRLSSEAKVIYKNPAADKLIAGMGFSEGEFYKILPENLKGLIAEALNTGRTLSDLEVNVSDRIYSYIIVPIIENNYVNLYAVDVTERKHGEQRLNSLSECFLEFGNNTDENINRLVTVCGKFMKAACAIYNRMERGMLCSVGKWKVPSDYKPLDKPEGHICEDVFMRSSPEPLIVRNLQESRYALTDPNVKAYNLKTYIGMAVKLDHHCIGSLCVVFQEDVIPSKEDLRFMGIVASAIAVEESRNHAYQALEEIRVRQKHIIDTVTDYIFTVHVHNGEAEETIYGPTCVSVTGYTSWEFVADPHLWIKIVPEEDRSVVTQHARSILNGEKVLPLEHRIIKKDGSLRWVRNTTVLHFNQEGELSSYDGLIQDITEHKQLDEALRDNEARLAWAQTSTHMGNWERNLVTNELHWSDEQYRLFGLQPQEVRPSLELFFNAVAPEDLEFVKKSVEGALNNKKPYDIDFSIIKPDGARRAVNAKVKVISDKTGKPVRLLGTIQDITERKRMEEELRGKERFLSSVFEGIQDGINIMDTEYNIVRVNSVMERWYAHAMPLVGKKCYEAYHSQNQPCKICPHRKTLETGATAYEVVPKRGPGGKIIGWLDLFSFPLIDLASGRTTGSIEYVRDITERRQAEIEQERLHKELIKSNQLLKQISLRDPHTGLYNHRYLQEVIEPEFYRAKRYGHSLSVMMLDVDYFKSINDVYGHTFGDLVLKQFARQLKMMVRQYDIVIRFGGEEFMIVSPVTDRPQALTLAQRLLDAINLYNFGTNNQTVKLKLSVAVASYPEDSITKGMDLVEIAEHILDKVKEYGGNNVYSSLDIKKNRTLLRKAGKVHTGIGFLKGKIEKLTKSTNQSLAEAVFAFAKTIDLKDHYTGEHVERTVRYATEISRALGLPKEEIEAIKQASILHDLGKIGISEKVLLKRLKLNAKEIEEIKKHPQIGVDIIRPIKFLHHIIPLILYHHERWDGLGYPNGLKGEDIPIGARIVAIADVYEALTSDRPYRKAYSKEKAVGIIKNSSGSHFDPHIVKNFLKIIEQD